MAFSMGGGIQISMVILPKDRCSFRVKIRIYYSNMAKSEMNSRMLQYLMGKSDILVKMNVYTHIRFNDAEEEFKCMEKFRKT